MDKKKVCMSVSLVEPLKACPFCGEANFDDIGLKYHLSSGHCEKYNDITLIGHG